MKKLHYKKSITLMLVALACASGGVAHANSKKSSQCQHPTNFYQGPQRAFQYTLEYQLGAPELSTEKSAGELAQAQSQYYSNKSSPFTKGTGFKTLGFYTPNLTLMAIPQVYYHKTIGDQWCGSVQSVRFVLYATPVTYLAKELTSRDCVAKQALAHQLQTHTILETLLKEAVSKKELFEEELVPLYTKTGVMGNSQEAIAKGIQVLEKQSLEVFSKKIMPVFKQQRLMQVDNPNKLTALAKSCDGAFYAFSTSIKAKR